MTARKRILICDDDRHGFAEKLRADLEGVEGVDEEFKVDVLQEEFEKAMTALEQRLKSAREGRIADYPDDAAQAFDRTDILVVDYNLFDFNPLFTGERVAYLARCYSRCGFIVALNQFEPYVEEYFDLTLKGHPESFADLNISSNSICNPGLWREPWQGFRPWYWPLLTRAHTEFRNRVDELKNHLRDRIFEHFGFDDSLSAVFPRSMTEFITRSGDPSATTFEQFVLHSGNGLRGRGDKPINDEAIARIAAARIGKWLERMILSAQDILVDAPHLVSRYQSLLLSEEKDVKAFNRTATFALDVRAALSPILEEDGFRFKKENWLSRPAWFWNKISNCEKIPEVSDPWSVDRTDLVFAEDVSRFILQEEAHRFVADLESAFVSRFVKRDLTIGKAEYIPEVRFSL